MRSNFRKYHLWLLFVVILITVTAFFLIRLKFKRPSPTPFNWHAQVVTLVGNGSPSFSDSSQPGQAGLSDPFGITIGQDGTLYVSDAGESNRIRKLTSKNVFETLAGGNEGFANGSGSQAAFNSPSGLAIDDDDNIYVADTGNNCIRKITPEGLVSTIAGNGTPGYRDGPAAAAQFDGPIGVALDHDGNVFVADTYNDRIRKITSDGQVTTLAGAGHPGYADGDAANALFDTPCALVIAADGTLIVADTGNGRLRRITPAGQVTTWSITLEGNSDASALRTPVGLALTHDGFVYTTELDRSTVVEIAPDGKACVIAGSGPGYADGDSARFNQPAGVAIDPRNGDLLVADSANYLVRRLSPSGGAGTAAASTQIAELLPRLTSESLGAQHLLWPIDPQDRPHEVIATVGEVRGTFDSTDSRDHLHSGLDVAGAYGDVVRAIRSEKVSSPIPNWGLDSLSEGLRIGVVSYIHIHVGRDKDAKLFSDSRFVPVKQDDGKLRWVRVKRGTRFRPGDALGTVNRMYHVHLVVGPSGAEINPLSLSPIGFSDTVPPTIEKDGIQLLDETGKRLTEKERGRLIVHGQVHIVVDAFDRTDMNGERRRLGLYRLGYQLFRASAIGNSASGKRLESATDLEPAPGFSEPRTTILFNRLPWGREAPKLAYAEESGITVYGSKSTRFLYEVTNTIRDGRATSGVWDTTAIPKGDYTLRIIAADYSGNEAQQGRDLPITIR